MSSMPPSFSQGFARSAGEAASPAFWQALVGAWVPTLGPTGTTLYDLSGYSNHAALQNMEVGTDWVVAVPPMSGYALETGDTAEFLEAPDRPWLNPGSSDFSLLMWVQTTTVERRIWSKRAACNSASMYAAVITNTGQFYFEGQHTSGGTYQAVNSMFPVTDGAWHCCVGVRQGVEWRAYVDGVLRNTNSYGATITISNTTTLKWGKDP